MANPSVGPYHVGYDEHDIICEGIVINGEKILTDQQTLVADAAAATAVPAALTGAANAALTATAIAASVPSNPPNVDEDGITAGAFIDRATRRAFVSSVLSLITHSTEIDLDYEAMLVDIALVIAQADKSTTDIAAQKVIYDKLITDVGLIRVQLAAALDVLESHGLMSDT